MRIRDPEKLDEEVIDLLDEVEGDEAMEELVMKTWLFDNIYRVEVGLL